MHKKKSVAHKRKHSIATSVEDSGKSVMKVHSTAKKHGLAHSKLKSASHMKKSMHKKHHEMD